VCVCVSVCLKRSCIQVSCKIITYTHYGLMTMMTPLPPKETQTHQLLSGTYPTAELKKPETEMRTLLRLNGDELTHMQTHAHATSRTCTLMPDDHDDPLPPNETQTHQLLSGTYQP